MGPKEADLVTYARRREIYQYVLTVLYIMTEVRL